MPEDVSGLRQELIKLKQENQQLRQQNEVLLNCRAADKTRMETLHKRCIDLLEDIAECNATIKTLRHKLNSEKNQ